MARFVGSDQIEVASPGTIAVNTRLSGGTLIAFSGATIDFFSATISGFAHGDTIDLAGLPFLGTTSATVTSTGTLSVDAGGASATLLFAGLNGHTAALAPDSDNAPSVTLACFAAGTRIITARGPVAAETLREGDRLRGIGGGKLPRYRQPASFRQSAWPDRAASGFCRAFGSDRLDRGDVWLCASASRWWYPDSCPRASRRAGRRNVRWCLA